MKMALPTGVNQNPIYEENGASIAIDITFPETRSLPEAPTFYTVINGKPLSGMIFIYSESIK